MATQMHPRISKRMPCSLETRDQRHTGLVLNVSQGGLFVQTNAAMPAGEAVDIALSPPDGGPTIPVQARVVWKRVVPQQLRTSARGGLGVQIEHADETFYRQLAEWMRVETGGEASVDGPPAAPPPEAHIAAPGGRVDFYVRLRKEGTTRSRRLGVVAPSSEDALRSAQDHVGSGWRVLEIQDLRESGDPDAGASE